MTAINLDRARSIPISHRIGRSAVFYMAFKYKTTGLPFDLRPFAWEWFLKKIHARDSVTKILHLTIGSGLDIVGADYNKLKVTITEEKAIELEPTSYHWQAVNITSVQTWVNGIFTAHNGDFDAGSDVDLELTVNTGDIILNVDITLAGSGIENLTDSDFLAIAEGVAPHINKF